MLLLESVEKVSLSATIHVLELLHVSGLDLQLFSKKLRQVSLLETIHVLDLTHVNGLDPDPFPKVSLLAKIHVLELPHVRMLDTNRKVSLLATSHVLRLVHVKVLVVMRDVLLLAITHVGMILPVLNWETVKLMIIIKGKLSLLVTTRVTVGFLVPYWENIMLDPSLLESLMMMPLSRVVQTNPVVIVIVALPVSDNP